jgi:hypothetical protein
MDAGEKGNREFGFLLSEFRREQAAARRERRNLRTRIRHIDLIDWTSVKDQPRVDYAKPHLQLLCVSGVQISLDAFSGGNPEI